ncbi:MAG: hypothetical protein ACYTF6_03990 [Planctomycetota bacterium]|jgi:hypothetical protein
MHPDDWTPARGWRIAMTRSLYRGAIGSAVSGAAVYLIWPIGPYILIYPSITFMIAMVSLSILCSAALGYPIGRFVAKKLEADSGLAGRSLFIPVVAVLVALQLCAGAAVVALRGSGEALCIFYFRTGAVVWSVIAAFKSLVVG